MYETFLEVLEATREKYANATRLCRIESLQASVYNHIPNGIGCAIGCHFTAEEAATIVNSGVHWIYRHPYSNAHSLFLMQSKFAPSIRADDLRLLQNTHDQAVDVDSFRAALDKMISTLKRGDQLPA